MSEEPRYPPGTQPYDVLNGARIGAVAGGVLGIVAAFFLGAAFVWLIIVGAVVGGGIGYLWERRAVARRGSS